MQRRSFLAGTGLAPALAAQSRSPRRFSAVDILRTPDSVVHRSSTGLTSLTKAGGGAWTAGDLSVITELRHTDSGAELPVTVSASKTAVEHIGLRWLGRFGSGTRFLGDHWERSYGDLEWRGFVPNRVMPWYFLATDGRSATGYGVQTGAACIAFWQADPEGVTLWLDLRNGAAGVQLGERRLNAVVLRCAGPIESPFAAAKALCRRLCDQPRLPRQPVYGGNNWYYTYGRNFTAQDILRDSAILADAAPAGSTNRPFMVIDMGWNPNREGAGPDKRGNVSFPDMPGLAAGMRQAGVRPGIWVRPLLNVDALPDAWRLPKSQDRFKAPFFVLDPSVPDALDYVRTSIRGIRDWGFELIKHDFSTYDILGKWGFEMGTLLTGPGWSFHDRSRTTAEIILAFYRALREAAGDSLLLGCNTIGHLGAGIFELQRIGDDTSGRDWERTRKMGVNTLAFRLPQHGTFFSADADCVPITTAIPWDMTRQWLDLVARSGTPLFVSADPKVYGDREKQAVRDAFRRAASEQPPAEPLDWLESTTAASWRFGRDSASYKWCGGAGASPFAT